MKISKAIEILTKMEKTLEHTMTISGIEAMELGIEALKRVKAAKNSQVHLCNRPLPGETEGG